MQTEETHYFKGRGAQIRTRNRYHKHEYVTEHIEGLDEPLLSEVTTQLYYEHPKKVVNKIESPDLGLSYSLNPYQGCEHGCVYCYARNAHEYWGFSAGTDFESKIIVKENAPQLLQEFLTKRNYKPVVITLSGNTDCYQPIERKLGITRRLLQVLNKYRNPVGFITKNTLILRDIDILKELAQDDLVAVHFSINSLNEELRRKLEPRTASYKNRLKAIEKLASSGIPVSVMCAPIIPGLNSHEVNNVIKAAADHGAINAGYTIVRLNGAIGGIFTDWVHKNFPDAAEKILNQIKSCHGGTLNDSNYGRRISGEGEIASSIKQMFKVAKNKYMGGGKPFKYNMTAFNPTPDKLTLF